MMSVYLICVGKLKDKFYLQASEEYLKRLGGYCKMTLLELPEEKLPQNPSQGQIGAALEKEAANMRNSLEIGDEIVTIGGIVGQVISIKNDTITIITSKDRTKIRFVKSAIREVTVKANEPIEKPAVSEDAPALKDDFDKADTENKE